MSLALIKTFDKFSRALVDSKDVDPVYIILPDITDFYGFDPLWFTFVYVSFYNLESAITICKEMPESDDFDSGKFLEMRNTTVNKFGHERRGTGRNAYRQIQHLSVVRDLIEQGRTDNNTWNWKSNTEFRNWLESTVPLVGNWASFKISEILEKAFGYDSIAIPDLGLDGRNPNSNDGPIGGLRWLYGREEEYDTSWFKVWNDFGFRLSKSYDYNIGQIETCLCKFHKLVSGKYFIGHDIQEFVELKHVLGDSFYTKMMSSHFDDLFWKDVDKLQKEYKQLYKKKQLLYAEQFGKTDSVDVLQLMLE